MKIQDSAPLFPQECIATHTCDGPFLDTEQYTRNGERVYLSLAYAKEIGRAVGFVPEVEQEEQASETARLAEELAELEVEYEALRDSIRRTLNSSSIIVRNGEERLMRLRPKQGTEVIRVGSLADEVELEKAAEQAKTVEEASVR